MDTTTSETTMTTAEGEMMTTSTMAKVRAAMLAAGAEHQDEHDGQEQWTYGDWIVTWATEPTEWYPRGMCGRAPSVARDYRARGRYWIPQTGADFWDLGEDFEGVLAHADVAADDDSKARALAIVGGGGWCMGLPLRVEHDVGTEVTAYLRFLAEVGAVAAELAPVLALVPLTHHDQSEPPSEPSLSELMSVSEAYVTAVRRWAPGAEGHVLALLRRVTALYSAAIVRTLGTGSAGRYAIVAPSCDPANRRLAVAAYVWDGLGVRRLSLDDAWDFGRHPWRYFVGEGDQNVETRPAPLCGHDGDGHGTVGHWVVGGDQAALCHTGWVGNEPPVAIPGCTGHVVPLATAQDILAFAEDLAGGLLGVVADRAAVRAA